MDEFDLFNDDDRFDAPPEANPHLGSTVLGKKDYNLNSPLTEWLCNHASKLKSGLERITTPQDQTILAFLNSVPHSALITSLHHKKFFQWLQTHEKNIFEPGRQVLIDVDNFAIETFEVPQVFLAEVFDQLASYKRRSDCPSELLHLLSILLELTHLTACINNQSIPLTKLAFHGYSPIQEKHYRYVNYPILKKVIYSDPLIYIVHMDLCVDQTFILMMKDIINSRFHSLMALYSNYPNLTHLEVLSNLYSQGDRVIRNHGNAGYDVIALVEPIINHRFCQRAELERPELPRFPEFGMYIEGEVSKYQRHYDCTSFLNFVLHSRFELVDLCTIYGSFRHWGHPYVDVSSGVPELKERLQLQRIVDTGYANQLASDLAKKVLLMMWRKNRKWYINVPMLPDHHILKMSLSQNQIPTNDELSQFGDHWHELPIQKCFEIPDMIDPSQIYSDKSHSLTRSELQRHINSNPTTPFVPSLKVIQSFMRRPATDWKAFFRKIDESGVDEDNLIIALREKERELKIKGRYFALMSWELREYFVVTEYLIKEHFVPLFAGLTMADDYQTVLKKMLDNTTGQGQESYENLTIANHIDYSKWCNSQSHEATHPIFSVMDKFLGFRNLISRTHSIFQKCWYYHKGSGFNLRIQGNQLVDKFGLNMCWTGSNGGLEGLRQKGWSIVSLLNIERSRKVRNTRVSLLAQGDNQVICTHYKVQSGWTPEQLRDQLYDVHSNNAVIMATVSDNITRLGMSLNKDETMQSADYLNYGKIPVYKGLFLCLETKRWARLSCTNNDQLPSLSTVLSTVGSCSLTVAHQSINPISAILHYHWAGTFVITLLSAFNPVIQDKFSLPNGNQRIAFFVRLLYRDPSLGGIGGMSLSRFMIRGFPDPVSEGLSFAKLIGQRVENQTIRAVFAETANPPIARTADITAMMKLMESPGSLNLKSSSSVTNIVKDAVRVELQASLDIGNEILRNALDYQKRHGQTLLAWLMSMSPWFPKFMSEFYSSSYSGIMESLIGIVQNSRTLKSVFSKRFEASIDAKLRASELANLSLLMSPVNPVSIFWNCSTLQADRLRRVSWRREIIGQTIPHPLEMLEKVHILRGTCTGCEEINPTFISSCAPQGALQSVRCRGPYKPYLGSATSEQTSLLTPWEKKSNVPVIKRAAKLANAIGWLTNENSNLSQSIQNLIRSLTDEDLGVYTGVLSRTGCPVHRYVSSRVSSGGYIAQSPTVCSYVITSSDGFHKLATDNYTFMFQPLLLFAQMVCSHEAESMNTMVSMHFHIGCQLCVIQAPNTTVESPSVFNFPDVSSALSKWKPESTPWFIIRPSFPVEEVSLVVTHSPLKLSWVIGLMAGFVYGLDILSGLRYDISNSLFPIAVRSKIRGREFLDGILHGFHIAVRGIVVTRRWCSSWANSHTLCLTAVRFLINRLSNDGQFQVLCEGSGFAEILLNDAVRLCPSFPMKASHLGNLLEQYLLQRSSNYNPDTYQVRGYLIIPGDFSDPKILGAFLVSLRMYEIMRNPNMEKKENQTKLKELNTIFGRIQEDNVEHVPSLNFLTSGIRLAKEEVRWLCKYLLRDKVTKVVRSPRTIMKVPGGGMLRKLGPSGKEHTTGRSEKRRSYSPLISGCRLRPFPTTSYYKLASLLAVKKIQYQDFICCGDGSGGLTHYLLTRSNTSRGIFNTLLTGNGRDFKGALPGLPHIFLKASENVVSRCINLKGLWQNPSDLTSWNTWAYFNYLEKTHDLELTLLVCDMETNDVSQYDLCFVNLLRFLRFGTRVRNVIFKGYADHIDQSDYLNQMFKNFKLVEMFVSDWSSCYSNEIYYICSGMRMYDTMDYSLSHSDFKWLTENLPSYKTADQELERAQKLMRLNQNSCSPSCLEALVVDELIGLLTWSGGRSGTALRFISELSLTGGDVGDLVYLTSVVLAQGLNLCIGSDELFYPTTRQCQAWGLSVVVFKYFFGVILNDSRLIFEADTYLDHYLRINFTKKTVLINGKPLQFGVVSLEPKRPDTAYLSKVIHFRSDSFKLSSYLRSLLGFWTIIGKPTTIDESKLLERFQSSYGGRLKDIFEFVSKRHLFTQDKPDELEEQIEFDDIIAK